MAAPKQPGSKQDKYPSISLCMIAKNEAEFIAQCIESVREIVSEIILVDTGSTDKTVEIAETYGARVFYRDWDDDFSAPRNLSLSKASCDWILVLDADEAIAESDLKQMQELTLQSNKAYEFLQRHYSNDPRLSAYKPCAGEYPEWEKKYQGFFTSNLCRLFPNHKNFEYRNRVHELVEHSIYENKNFTIERSRIPIHHYGHTPEVKAKKKKSTIYTPLGSIKVKEDPQNWKNHYELAVEYNCNGNKLESVFAFRTAAALNPHYVDTWINLGYVLTELSAHGSAIEALKRALNLDPNNAEAHCNLAVTYMRLKRPMFAETHLRRALDEKPDYVNAINNLGQLYFANGRLEDAENELQRALNMLPGNPATMTDLAAIKLEKGEIDRSIEMLQEVAEIDPRFVRAQYFLSLAYKKNNATLEAINTLKELCQNLSQEEDDGGMLAGFKQTYQSWESELSS